MAYSGSQPEHTIIIIGDRHSLCSVAAFVATLSGDVRVEDETGGMVHLIRNEIGEDERLLAELKRDIRQLSTPAHFDDLLRPHTPSIRVPKSIGKPTGCKAKTFFRKR